MVNFSEIKLVIWDLDETFWSGVLSDGTVVIDEKNIALIKQMVDCGVMCSICSKNDEKAVQELLIKKGIWDLFVFPSINWTPKGSRVSQIIQQMNLREPNVLFIDDNATNRGEVKAACKKIMVASEEIIADLIQYFKSSEKNDKEHKRLKQYKVLEKKTQFKALVGSNEEFLRECAIRVEIKYDCQEHIERILDLILRSNQLNFTKVRSTKEELYTLLQDNTVKSGYVEVRDKFGEYGIVGFFAVKNNKLIHFTFSCRTLNMGVEQYVYAQLGSPVIEIQGEVASKLDTPIPFWINQSKAQTEVKKESLAKGKILIKGLCDMQQIFAFIHDSKSILKEMVYVNDKGVSIESGCHTCQILESQTLSKELAEHIITTLPFGDKDMFTTAMFDKDIDFVVLSLLTDANLGLYREKETGAIVAFGEYTNDLTNETLWEKFISKELFVANCCFTMENLQYIKEHYEFIGRSKPEEVLKNLDIILENLAPQTSLILLLGSEMPYEENKQKAYEERHLYHQELNKKVRKWAAEKEKVYLLDVNQYLQGQGDFTNNINHFTKPIYYSLSQALLAIVNSGSSVELKPSGQLEQKIAPIIRKVRKIPSVVKRKIYQYRHR